MDHRHIAAQELEVMGAFRSPWLRPAFHAVDREAFAPARFWSPVADSEGLYPVIDRDLDEDVWRRTVWGTHASLVTQMNDGATRVEDGPARGDFSSSISALDIAFEKLHQLDLAPDHRVLHLGTASGYDSALLCERVGPGRLTTLEYDGALSAWGRQNLHAAGYAPTAVCGDGLEGWEPTAPYDRIIATASVRRIPDAWRHQAAEGALIVTPYTTAYGSGGALLKLTVDAEGVATGRFVGSAFYMLARSHRSTRHLDPPAEFTRTSSRIDPAELLGGTWGQDFILGLTLPDISLTKRGDGETRQVQFWDATGTDVTIVNYHRWWKPDAVTVYGPRNLWEEVVGAYSRWKHAGGPHYTRYGLTVDDTGTRPWLDEPAHGVGPGTP
ncbi:hypothetical protein AB0C93_24450 [Streptomyces sp. NPDC048518]|uniref:protein-L-isoaspartate O-methyltransferase family protein n=1 Tax=Streptomyces sp. NPDC048518 TaxID=3155029 RepID=UPI00340314EE